MSDYDMLLEEYPPAFVVSLTVALIIECVGGLTCNLIVLAIYHGTALNVRRNENVFIINLNVVDIVMCLTAIPITAVLLQSSSQHEILVCYFHKATVSFASTASAVTLLTISVDRYESVVTPLKKKLIQVNAKRALAIVWIVAIFGFICPFVGIKTDSVGLQVQNHSNHSSLTCQNLILSTRFVSFHETYYVLFFFISMTGMLVCYFHIFRVAKHRLAVRLALIRASLAFPGANTGEALRKLQDRKVTKMTLAIVSSFMICWGPHIALTCVSLVLVDDVTVEMVRYACLALAFSTAMLHPLLYAFMRQDFRQNVKNRWFAQKYFFWKRRRSLRISPNVSVINQRSPPTVTVGEAVSE